jgi:hypothetical protein
MNAIPLNDDPNLVVKVRLLAKQDDAEISGTEYAVRLYDKDIFNDDFLGQSTPDEGGVATFTFTKNDFTKPFNFDDRPDFYFVVYKNDKEIFRSKVMSNLDLSNIQEFVMKEGEVIDLGTYLVNND